MTRATVIEFAKQLEQDAGLRARVSRVTGERREALAEIARLACDAGFELDAARLEAGYRELASDELNERQLEDVAAGAVGPCFMPRQRLQLTAFTGLMSKLVPAGSPLGVIAPCD